MAIKITLDPGHGRTGNPYPPQKGYYEGTQMWKLANFLKTELEKYGFEVVTTRPNLNDDPSLSTRGQTAGKNGSAMFISLHSNAPASASDTKPTGSVIYYSLTDANNKVFADKLGKKVSEVMGHYYRGSLTRASSSGADYYGVIRAAAQSGCKAAFIVEHGFHTNIKDSAFLIVDANLQKLAVEEAKVIAQHFGQDTKEKPPQVNPGVLYRVQTGAFSVKSNADALLAKVKAAGFDTYMVKINGLYKVQVGAFSVKTNADAMAAKLKAKGFDVYITTESGTPVASETQKTKPEIKVGSKVKIKQNANVYGKTTKFQSWVYPLTWIVHSMSGDRVVINKDTTGKYAIMSPVKLSDLTLVG